LIACIDSSVLLSRYLSGPRSREAETLTSQPSVIVACRITYVEVMRGVSFIASAVEQAMSTMMFQDAWRRFTVVEIDEQLAQLAASIATVSGVRTLDAFHVAVATRTGADAFITFDQRQAQAARAFDLNVLGVAPDQT
jgi:predicted nucleic acid-binding protein